MINVKNELAKIQRSAQTDPRFKHHEEIVITKEAESHVARLFNSMLPNFPAWRQTCPDAESLGRMKLAYTKAIMRHEQSTGKELNIKAGLLACEKSDSDWMPSAGKFIKWCEQSNDLLPLAQRAFKIFSAPTWNQKQTCNIGQMVVVSHGFKLKNMKASECEKTFIELYLKYAEDNPIQHLDAFAITEVVQLSQEQQKDAKKRADKARELCVSSLLGGVSHKPKDKPAKVKAGISKGRIATTNKSQKQMEAERDKQLKAMGLK